jgi:replication-associated recombination protein RarA
MYDDYLLLIDEIDKMACKDQTFLLNLMETGIVLEGKHHKTRTIRNVKTWLFATSNNFSKVILPLQSRFFVVNLEPYTYEQFYQIIVQLLTSSTKLNATANAIWDKSAQISYALINLSYLILNDNVCQFHNI